jgi:hypothetical protein
MPRRRRARARICTPAKPVSTADRIGEECGVRGRSIKTWGRFAIAIEQLTEALSIDARHAIMTGGAKVSREEVIMLASVLDGDTTRAIWGELMATGKTGLARLIAKLQGDKKAKPKPKPKPATDRYGIADLVRLIAKHWSPQDFEEASKNLDANHIAVVQQHIGGALRNLIGIAQLTGCGLEALDAWFDAQQADEDENELGGDPLRSFSPFLSRLRTDRIRSVGACKSGSSGLLMGSTMRQRRARSTSAHRCSRASCAAARSTPRRWPGSRRT